MTTTAILLVDHSTTRCSHCGASAFPEDSHHTRIATGYGSAGPLRPCGARFVAIKGVIGMVQAADLRALRPDLPIA
ncbi:hypothetical protein [Streptomyces sp. NPDC001889]